MTLQRLALVLAAAISLPAFSADHDSYPSKPVRILVPTPPGGGNDIMARMAAQKMNEHWSQEI